MFTQPGGWRLLVGDTPNLKLSGYKIFSLITTLTGRLNQLRRADTKLKRSTLDN